MAAQAGHSLTTLLTLGGVLLSANAIQSVTSVYWTEAPLSLWGELVAMVLLLAVASTALVLVAARRYDMPLSLAFAIDDDPTQRTVCRRHKGRMTVGQTMLAISVINALAAVSSWYGTPPSRTPPIIQALFNSLIVIFAAPASKLLLRDRKVYCAARPAFAATLLLAAAAVSLAPSFTSAGGAAAQFSGSGAGAWSVFYAVAQIPNAFALVAGQLFQVSGLWEGVMSLTPGERIPRDSTCPAHAMPPAPSPGACWRSGAWHQ